MHIPKEGHALALRLVIGVREHGPPLGSTSKQCKHKSTKAVWICQLKGRHSRIIGTAIGSIDSVVRANRKQLITTEVIAITFKALLYCHAMQ